MKKLIAIVLFLAVSPIFAEDWKGKSVFIYPDTLMCDYFHMESALILQQAGDADSVNAYIQKGYCLATSETFIATVTGDTSSYSDEPIIEVVLKGASAWMSKGRAQCCYSKVGDDWKYYESEEELRELKAKQASARKTDRRAEWKVATPSKRIEECNQARQHLKDLEGAGLTGTAQYQRESAFVDLCDGEG